MIDRARNVWKKFVINTTRLGQNKPKIGFFEVMKKSSP